MTTMLSQHFSLEEMTASQTAARLGIDNSPNPVQLGNLKRTCAMLEEVRETLSAEVADGNCPLSISSGLRVEELNNATPGSARNPPSAHTEGRAGDFHATKFGTPLQVAQRLAASNIQFDQLIYEFASWVHIAVPKEGEAPRRQVLTINRSGTHVGLVP